MKWKNTWILVGLAAALFAFIFLFERSIPISGSVPPAKPLFVQFKPTTATSMTLRRGNEFLPLSLERTNDSWRYLKPFTYPAAYFAVQNFLETLERVVPSAYITPREILSRKQSSADFGFDAPLIAIALERGEERLDVRFGARTPAGDQVYVQIGSDPSIFVVNADLLDRIPRTPNDWRNAALFDLGDDKPDKLEILHNGTGYLLQLDPTNKLWKLARPAHRADQNQVRELIRRIQLGRVVEFVSDDPRADGDGYGLHAPEYEVMLGSGALARRVQFGRSPTNNPGLVYARLLSHSNVVLVAKSAVEPLTMQYAELRDRQIISFAPELVDLIEVKSDETFEVRRDATSIWKAAEIAADPAFVAEWLKMLSQLEASEFERDVVEDFSRYGLDPGQRQYTLRTAVTNATGVTNVPIARLAFGTNAEGRTFARRFDEKSIYAISAWDFSHMPTAAWQFREHRIWNFTTNQVVRITVREGQTTREVIRQPNGQWIDVKGWPTTVNQFALEEVTRSLGELTATMWLARGEDVRERFGFGTNPTQFIVALGGDQPQTLMVEFGRLAPTRLPYALTMVEGQPTVFEFPWVLYADLQRYFHLALPKTTP
jgi:hypothetical protein